MLVKTIVTVFWNCWSSWHRSWWILCTHHEDLAWRRRTESSMEPDESPAKLTFIVTEPSSWKRTGTNALLCKVAATHFVLTVSSLLLHLTTKFPCASSPCNAIVQGTRRIFHGLFPLNYIGEPFASKFAGTHSTKGWMGPSAFSTWYKYNICNFFVGYRNFAVQPVASQFTKLKSHSCKQTYNGLTKDQNTQNKFTAALSPGWLETEM